MGLLVLNGHEDEVYSISWSPDGKWLASGSFDRTVRLWDPVTTKCVRVLEGHTNTVNEVKWSPDGKWIASASDDHTVRIWEPETGKLHAELIGHLRWVMTLDWTRDCSGMVTGADDGSVRLWEMETLQTVAVLSRRPAIKQAHDGACNCVAWSEGLVATAGADDVIRLWDITPAGQNQCIRQLEGHTYPVFGLSWRSDGHRLASASEDYTARIWDPETGECVITLLDHTDAVMSIAWSPDELRLGTSSGDRSIRMWKADTGECNLTIPQAHAFTIGCVAFAPLGSPVGRAVASCSCDRSIRIWTRESTGLTPPPSPRKPGKEADKPLDRPVQPLPLKPWSVQANVNRSGALEFAANGVPQSSANGKPPNGTSSPPEASMPSSEPEPHVSSAPTSAQPPLLPSQPSSSASPTLPPTKPFAPGRAHTPVVESEPDDSERTTDSEKDVPQSLPKPRKPFTVSRLTIDTSLSGESEQRFTSHQRAASRSELMLAELADSEATTPSGPALRSREQPRSSARLRKELQVLSLTVPIIPFNALILDPQALFMSSRKIVYNGKWGTRSVAVLILAQGSLDTDGVMFARVGGHPAVTSILGTSVDSRGRAVVVTENGPLGSLDQVLESLEGEVAHTVLVHAIMQVCEAMQMMAEAHLIHRALALRHVLVSSFHATDWRQVRVKIANYSLTGEGKQFYGDSVDLPMRWMAPEALDRRQWSEKSDVWAFGVMMWEIWSFGRCPFGVVQSDERVGQMVIDGKRLGRPPGTPAAVYEVMQRCWAHRPTDRPSFHELRGALLELFMAVHTEEVIDR